MPWANVSKVWLNDPKVSLSNNEGGRPSAAMEYGFKNMCRRDWYVLRMLI